MESKPLFWMLNRINAVGLLQIQSSHGFSMFCAACKASLEIGLTATFSCSSCKILAAFFYLEQLLLICLGFDNCVADHSSVP